MAKQILGWKSYRGDKSLKDGFFQIRINSSGIVLSILNGYPTYEKFVGCDNQTLLDQVAWLT